MADGWLVGRFAPVTLFSLKGSFATSSVGTTLVVPTPYAVKMALVDAAFRAGWRDDECAALLAGLVRVPVRIAPPDAVVTHTFNKIRQEPKPEKGKEKPPFLSSIAYREYAAQRGEWAWAFGVAPGTQEAEWIAALLPVVRYVGKRGSFVQYVGQEWRAELDASFTAPVGELQHVPTRAHVVPLDDFGPEASLDVLSSFSEKPARRGKHRVFVETMVPLGRVRAGPGFTEYRR